MKSNCAWPDAEGILVLAKEQVQYLTGVSFLVSFFYYNWTDTSTLLEMRYRAWRVHATCTIVHAVDIQQSEIK